MSFENQKGLIEILKKFQDGDTTLYQTVRRVQSLYRGLRLDCEEISLECISCGKEIEPFSYDHKCLIIFDPGSPDSRDHPGEPASVYLECEICSGEEDDR